MHFIVPWALRMLSFGIASRQQHFSSAVQRALGANNVVLRKTFRYWLPLRNSTYRVQFNVPSAQTMLSFGKQIHYCLPFSNNTYKVEFIVSSALTVLSLAKHKHVLIAHRQRHYIYMCNSSCPQQQYPVKRCRLSPIIIAKKYHVKR